MKKYIISIILILTFCSASAFSQDMEVTASEGMIPVSADQDVLFKSFMPANANLSSDDDTDDKKEEGMLDPAAIFYLDDAREYQDIDPDNMPFFKQMRLKMSNKILEKQYKNNPDEQSPKPINWKFWRKNDIDENEIKQSENVISDSIQAETSEDIDVSEETLSLSGGINKSVTEKEMYLDSENIKFDEETGDIIANDRPVLNIPPQDTKIIADTIIYNEYSNIIKGIGNVIVFKNGIPTTGNYLEIDMNEETMLMDDVVSKTTSANATAETALQKDDVLHLTKGTFYSDKSEIQRIMTQVAGPDFNAMIVDPASQALLFGNPAGSQITLNIKNLYIDARKNHDVIRAKNIKIYHKDRYIMKWPSMTVYTNKKHSYFEANYPELGSNNKIGMFAGPGFTFGGPGSSIIKVVPYLNYKNKFGIGGLIKYVNSYNRTYLGYGSANNLFYLQGKQILDDNLFLQYGANTYDDEWFMGARMAKYMAEIYYDKAYNNPNFLGKKMNLGFRHRLGFGLMQNDDRNVNGEKLNTSNMSTTRTRYMAELSQTLYSYKNKKHRFYFRAGLLMQGSAALYGTGDTQFIARFGPTVSMQYKNWMQTFEYFISGYQDHTPLPVYDAYRYGHQSLRITEALRLTKYFSVGWSGYINMGSDSPNGEMFQENAFLIALGPDDCRLILGYDFTRERTYFGINVAFDTKGTNINYEKMEIKNPERFGKKYTRPEDEEKNVAYVKNSDRPELPSSKRHKFGPEKPAVLEYAQVIDIEDPERERIE